MNRQNVQEVRVIDVDISFGSMIWLMVKWALASIPAFFILAAIGSLTWLVIAGSMMSR